MTHEEAVARWLQTDGVGVEIGAFHNPVPGIRPIYVDRFARFAGEKCRADYWGDARDLPFRDHALDYVVSSHVLEHVANPVRALLEWHRVLRPGGVIYLVVPDRRHTWDHPRRPTEPEHMWRDFLQNTSDHDPTHIDDLAYHVDWSTYSPTTPSAEVPAAQDALSALYRTSLAEGRAINMHFHVFDPTNLRPFFDLVRARLRLAWHVVAEVERFPDSCPNGILLVVRVAKDWRARRDARRLHRLARANPRVILRPDARPFES